MNVLERAKPGFLTSAVGDVLDIVQERAVRIAARESDHFDIAADPDGFRGQAAQTQFHATARAVMQHVNPGFSGRNDSPVQAKAAIEEFTASKTRDVLRRNEANHPRRGRVVEQCGGAEVGAPNHAPDWFPFHIGYGRGDPDNPHPSPDRILAQQSPLRFEKDVDGDSMPAYFSNCSAALLRFERLYNTLHRYESILDIPGPQSISLDQQRRRHFPGTVYQYGGIEDNGVQLAVRSYAGYGDDLARLVRR